MKTEEFGALFEAWMAEKRQEMKDRYDRVLPSGELIFNRFEKGKYLKCGEGSSVYDTSVVMGEVEIGDHVWVGPYTLLEGSNAKLKIGNFVSIDAGVMIYTHDSTRYTPRTSTPWSQSGALRYAKSAVNFSSTAKNSDDKSCDG